MRANWNPPREESGVSGVYSLFVEMSMRVRMCTANHACDIPSFEDSSTSSATTSPFPFQAAIEILIRSNEFSSALQASASVFTVRTTEKTPKLGCVQIDLEKDENGVGNM